ncbi:centrosomal protein of 112 kDa-like [Nilaparvata lugens]|uniref:centrosomal protein of 112 kDa-like n=1 Tax=Nilaparvata lugens TaxID=108931 RepID=UPI00193D8551|nr:centrosomal protein of 112 kDa-like [Nilaparvata lugens]
MANHDLDAKYDADFKSGLVKIKPFILDLQKQEHVYLCRIWLEKLIKSEHSERELRNIYLEELCKNVQNNDLAAPFDKSPTDGPLQPITAGPEYLLSKETIELVETSLCPDEKPNTECQKDELSTQESLLGQSSDSEEECCAEFGSSESLASVPCVSARVDSNTSYESVQEQLQNEVEEKLISSSKIESETSVMKEEILQLKNENNTLKEEIKMKNTVIHDLEIERDCLNEKMIVLNKNLENVNVELKQLQDFEKGYIQARKDVELWTGKYKIFEARYSDMESNYLKKIEEYQNSNRNLKSEVKS